MSENSVMVISHPVEYFEYKERSLDEMIKGIALTEEEIKKIRDGHAIKTFDDKVLGKIPCYKLAKSLLVWNKEVDKEIKEAKKEVLLVSGLQKIESMAGDIDSIKRFIVNPSGNTLFNQLTKIIDGNPPDEELLEHLSSALAYIAMSDFEMLFNDHKYALAQIEQLSPHSLTIITDFKNWPSFNPGSFQSNGATISSDWLEAFATAYVQYKHIMNTNVIKLVKHCINDLISKRFVIATLQSENTAAVQLTDIGQTIRKYVDVKR